MHSLHIFYRERLYSHEVWLRILRLCQGNISQGGQCSARKKYFHHDLRSQLLRMVYRLALEAYLILFILPEA